MATKRYEVEVCVTANGTTRYVVLADNKMQAVKTAKEMAAYDYDKGDIKLNGGLYVATAISECES